MVREGNGEVCSRREGFDDGLGASLVDKPSVSGKVSSFATCANLSAAALGSGILSLPWAGAGASVVPAVVLTGLALALNFWTTLIVVEAAEKHQVFDLGGLLAHLPGRLGSSSQVANNVAIFVSQFVTLVAYCIIVADSIIAVAGGSRVACIAVFSLAVLPLSFASLEYLAFTSSLAIVVVLYIIAYTAYLSFSEPLVQLPGNQLCMLGFTKGIVSMISALIVSTVIQLFVLPMYEELADRSVRKFRNILAASFSFVFLLYAGFTVLALFAFGRGVQSNVIDSMPDSTPARVARLSMVLVILGVYPINVKPMTAMITDRRFAAFLTPCIIVTVMLLAFVFKDLGVMNVLNGALCMGAWVTIGPALIGLYLLKSNRYAMVGLIIFGVVMTFLGSVFFDNYLDDLVSSCFLW